MILEQRIIFHPFAHGDLSVARFSGGSELCLVLVHEIVWFMRVKIALHSSAG
jgi:hypothetical protein